MEKIYHNNLSQTNNLSHQAQFFNLAQDLLSDPTVLSMDQWLHHGKITCLEHSLFVAYISYRIGDFFHLDTQALARAGILHDFYLYHKRDKTAHQGLQCFDHPVIAVENAKKITNLSAKEENIILSHMWPFCACLPKSLEAILVNTVDTCAAFLEFSGIHYAKPLCKKLLFVHKI